MSSIFKQPRVARGARIAVLAGLLGLLLLGGRRAVLGPAVRCIRPQRGPLVQRVVLTGRVLTPGKTQIGPRMLGTVTDVLVDVGSHVTLGQQLVRLDDTEQLAAVAQARASVALASAQLGQVRQVNNRVAAASLEEATIQLEQARRELGRMEQLSQSGAITPQSIDAARDSVTAAATRLASAEARASGAKGADSQLAGARIAEANANLRLAEARLAQTVLLAPADGTILLRQVEPGDIVQPGKVLLVLARDGEIRLEAQSDEKNLTWLALGQRALVVADGRPERVFPATLSWLSPAVDLDRGTVLVRFALTERTAELIPDMTVSINLDITRRPEARLLPLAAVRDGDTDHPWVLALQGRRTKRVPVTLGPRGNDRIEILSGIDDKTTVVAQSGVAEGARVRESRDD